MGCCSSKQDDDKKDDKKKGHQRNAPSTVSYDFERQKGMQRALKDIGRREPIHVKPLDLRRAKSEEPMKESRKKQMGKKKNAFTTHKHHI